MTNHYVLILPVASISASSAPFSQSLIPCLSNSKSQNLSFNRGKQGFLQGYFPHHIFFLLSFLPSPRPHPSQSLLKSDFSPCSLSSTRLTHCCVNLLMWSSDHLTSSSFEYLRCLLLLNCASTSLGAIKIKLSSRKSFQG